MAEEISRELLQRGFDVLSLAMDDYDITELPKQKHAIFVIRNYRLVSK